MSNLIDGELALCGGCREEIREDLRRHMPVPRIYGQDLQMRKWT